MSRCLALIALLLAVSSAQAQKAEEMGTPEQRQACSHDVGRYCKMVKPEEGPFAYLACLQKNREKLRPQCLKVIEGGG
jgi:nitrous oxide reductase accessory protein NosL